MKRPRHPRTNEPRRGIILLVVLVMLTLFAVVGLTFVFYADAEATASRATRESLAQRPPEMEPEQALSFFLSQFLFSNDDQSGVYSALRGHELARLMYGGNDQALNNVPFTGVGRLRGDNVTFTVNG